MLSERGPFASRATFVLDDQGVLRHVEPKVDVDQHGKDLVALLESLQG